MNELRTRVRIWLMVFGWFGIFLAIMPSFEFEGGITANAVMMKHLQANPTDMPFTEVYHFGWDFSPLIRYRTEQHLTAKEDGTFESRKTTFFHFGWESWSFVTLVIGLGLILLAHCLGSKCSKTEKESPQQPTENHVS